MASKNLDVLDGLNVDGVSTLNANLNVDAQTLFVDSTLNGVGIQKLPAANRALDVSGNVHCTALHGDASQVTGLDASQISNLNFLANNASTTYGGSSPVLTFAGTSTLRIQSGKIELYEDQSIQMGHLSSNVALSYDATNEQMDFEGANVAFDADTLFIDTTGDKISVNAAIDGTQNFVVDMQGDQRTKGNISATGDVTAYSSDARLKKNLKAIEQPLEKISKIQGYTFEWDKEKCDEVGFTPSNDVEHGVIAQEIEEIMPDLIAKSAFDPEYKTVKYDRLTSLLISAVKELTSKVESLETEVENLRNKNP